MEIDTTKQELINKLFDDASRNDSSFATKKEIYLSLLALCGLRMLEYEDELEMVSFLKSFNFISTSLITNQLLSNPATATLSESRIALIVSQNYISRLGCDIAARLLIVLQTSPYN